VVPDVYAVSRAGDPVSVVVVCQAPVIEDCQQKLGRYALMHPHNHARVVHQRWLEDKALSSLIPLPGCAIGSLAASHLNAAATFTPRNAQG
jgi:hypothetical protein